ncbi:hypothetical protein [Chryseobacterium sp. MA9]|uniref:hypothetical protein n=1 Tax=Chryseobacterium sp. MA9 TaxID=2966625 RepID=UPI002107B857|nr:hypothetical protein [Chryseobacterium sp. MA9]UTX48921.1 hypothetical protein KIK00_01230 [Chryseobacterium sp. MA9]
MKSIGIIATIVGIVFLGIFYYSLEDFFYSDFGCGCSSACIGYYPDMLSRVIGYGLLIASTILLVASIWKFKRLSRFWTIPALFIFGIAFYGNGYMIFDKGTCGYSLNKTTFFVHQTKLGDYAKADGETIDLNSLKVGKLKGKLLGYAIYGNELTAFRIGEKPLKIKTSFLFWKVQKNVIINHISYGLNTFRNMEAEKIKGHYEFIGGQGMTEKDFLNELVLTQKELSGRLKNKKIIDNIDGTTRFLFEKD